MPNNTAYGVPASIANHVHILKCCHTRVAVGLYFERLLSVVRYCLNSVLLENYFRATVYSRESVRLRKIATNINPSPGP